MWNNKTPSRCTTPENGRWPALAALLLMSVATTMAQDVHRKPARQIEPEQVGRHHVPEASGLTEYPIGSGVFWTHGDSGTEALIFAISADGTRLARFKPEGAFNLDWESITADEQGNLYLGDVGNNLPADMPFGGLVKSVFHRQVYVIKAPAVDPKSVPVFEIQSVPVERVLRYQLPRADFDVEAMFVHQGELYLIEKTKETPVSVYRIGPTTGNAPANLQRVVDFGGEANMVTGAEMSPDGRWLALCSYSYVAVYRIDPDRPMDKQSLSRPAVFRFRPMNIESCCWIGPDLLMASEGDEVYRLNISQVLKTAPMQPAKVSVPTAN